MEDEKEQEVKLTHIQIRLSYEQKSIIKDLADQYKMNVSEWIRFRSMTTCDAGDYEME